MGDLSRTKRDSLWLEKAWVLGVYPTCGTCFPPRRRIRRVNATRLPQQLGSLSGDATQGTSSKAANSYAKECKLRKLHRFPEYSLAN